MSRTESPAIELGFFVSRDQTRGAEEGTCQAV